MAASNLPATALGLFLFVVAGCGGQPLEPWHTVRLSEEFTAGDLDEVTNFAEYLALEDRLFEELREEIYTEVETGPQYGIVRYSSGSAADPATREKDYNRTFELKSDEPKGGILLLHGMSDSPYSLHTLGEKLNAEGYWVIGLRLPGHGTAPSALKHVKWKDMAAAALLAMDHLVANVGEKPVHIAGYSTGAPLGLDLVLNSLDDPALRRPDSLILISPAIGISAAAAMARPTAAIGRVPGFSRVGWASITPEFDPYKYNSFTTNAGSQVHQLTRSVSNRIAALARAGNASSMPPILVFKSTVDATVSTDAVVDRLLVHLPDNDNEFVLFDLNRTAWTSILLVSDPGPFTKRLMEDPSLPFAVRLIANETTDSSTVAAHYKPAFAAEVLESESLGLAWPRGVISLSHVALPFAPDDPLYGRVRPEDESVLFLGQAEIRGERGLLAIPSDWLLRIRYNPFYSALEMRVLDWLGALEH